VKPRAFASRVAFAGFASLVGMFFALPMLWLVFAPFNSRATLAAKPSRPTLDNFREVFIERHDVPRALGISALLVVGTVVIVIAVGAPASYALSRIRFPGRDVFLYMLLLLSSVVAGSAAILPLYLLMYELGLIDTYRGIWLALAGGLLPASMFILKDFTDSIPRSYEESARVFGASSFQALRHIVMPVIRPGLAVIAVWTAVQVWGSFLVPFILFGGPGRRPAAVLMYTFQDEGGGADIGPLAAFALVYTIPILVLYWFVNKRYGFRFHGGIKR
jgi:multiple sugar transport system permease protein